MYISILYIIVLFFLLIVFFFFFFFFFFQAEDGIRDLYVTGVQTCALPIWRRTGAPSVAITAAVDPPLDPAPRRRSGFAGARPGGTMGAPGLRTASPSRSEERRVGKECRSRWSPDHEKKKTKAREKGGTKVE